MAVTTASQDIKRPRKGRSMKDITQQDKNRLILEELRRLYPDAGPALNFSNPYETLVATILSAQCTDQRVNLVTPQVFRDFPTPAAMAEKM